MRLVKVRIEAVQFARTCTMNVVPPITNSGFLVKDSSVWTEESVLASVWLTIVPEMMTTKVR